MMLKVRETQDMNKCSNSRSEIEWLVRNSNRITEQNDEAAN